MTALVCGGAGSGKSAWAERLLCTLAGDAARVYLATMRPWGEEAERRIARHRAQRAGRGFQTRERCVDLAAWDAPEGCALLLEDLGNLCANELFDPEGSGSVNGIVPGLRKLQTRCASLVIVSNETGSDGAPCQGGNLRFQSGLAWLNRRAAALSDRVYEVSGGCAVEYKEALGCGG